MPISTVKEYHVRLRYSVSTEPMVVPGTKDRESECITKVNLIMQKVLSLDNECNNPMEIDLVILVAKALHDQSSVKEIDDLSKQKRHVKSGEVFRRAGSTNFV
ncbi:hypothetical protein J6590_071456 [Homalodisca vitripennis]|nr:hypothetical protein J6590_071456 [Homalodisca vitripennis]